MATVIGLTALSIDLMLPAFDDMRADFGLAADATETASIVTVFFFGLAIAQLVYGPLADRFGRKPVVYGGMVVFVLGAVGAAFSPTLGWMLVFRFIWGVGAAGPRVIALSVIRDIYEGDRMARIMSFIAAVFIFVPIIAPTIGALLLEFVSWRVLFLLVAASTGGVALWLTRLPETLHEEYRIPRLKVATVTHAIRAVVTNRQAVGYTMGMTLAFGALVSYLAGSELVWDDVYGRGDQFPLIFGGLAAAIGFAILMNGIFVDRVGARRIVHVALFSYAGISGAALILAISGGGIPGFWPFVVLLGLAMASHGLFIPNARSIAILPLGQVAGTASAVIGSFSLLGASIIGTITDGLFDGTVVPMISTFFLGSLGALIIIIVTERGRLFGDT
ncbi:MAG: multidrug effflux MFS transporter [Acidimicrobiia bacterium]|nr:multidrug effflux MFS transporter [Acidimicrobiia bacterium]